MDGQLIDSADVPSDQSVVRHGGAEQDLEDGGGGTQGETVIAEPVVVAPPEDTEKQRDAMPVWLLQELTGAMSGRTLLIRNQSHFEAAQEWLIKNPKNLTLTLNPSMEFKSLIQRARR